jgi:hypothetical protein
MSITLELSDNKWRPPADLPMLWEENRDALLALPLMAALGGEWHHTRGGAIETGGGRRLHALLQAALVKLEPIQTTASRESDQRVALAAWQQQRCWQSVGGNDRTAVPIGPSRC